VRMPAAARRKESGRDFPGCRKRMVRRCHK
jgi:hypothetical protein